MSARSAAALALTVLRGGAAYARAVAAGDWADQDTIELRRAICRGCPSRTVARLPGMTADASWCGPPLEPGADPDTCGCPLAGKTAVASAECPQQRWSAAKPRP